MAKKKRMDPGGRLVIAVLARKGQLSEEEKAKSVMVLLEDGLTLLKIRELFPGLLSDPSPVSRVAP